MSDEGIGNNNTTNATIIHKWKNTNVLSWMSWINAIRFPGNDFSLYMYFYSYQTQKKVDCSIKPVKESLSSRGRLLCSVRYNNYISGWTESPLTFLKCPQLVPPSAAPEVGEWTVPWGPAWQQVSHRMPSSLHQSHPGAAWGLMCHHSVALLGVCACTASKPEVNNSQYLEQLQTHINLMQIWRLLISINWVS